MSGRPVTRAASGAGAVLALVILAELGILVLDRTPPPLVLAVPRHRFGESPIEGHFRSPADGLELRGVERIPSIVPGPVCHRPDERRGLAEQVEDAVREIDISNLIAAADVVDLAGDTALDQQIDRA